MLVLWWIPAFWLVVLSTVDGLTVTGQAKRNSHSDYDTQVTLSSSWNCGKQNVLSIIVLSEGAAGDCAGDTDLLSYTTLEKAGEECAEETDICLKVRYEGEDKHHVPSIEEKDGSKKVLVNFKKDARVGAVYCVLFVETGMSGQSWTYEETGSLDVFGALGDTLDGTLTLFEIGFGKFETSTNFFDRNRSYQADLAFTAGSAALTKEVWSSESTAGASTPSDGGETGDATHTGQYVQEAAVAYTVSLEPSTTIPWKQRGTIKITADESANQSRLVMKNFVAQCGQKSTGNWLFFRKLKFYDDTLPVKPMNGGYCASSLSSGCTFGLPLACYMGAKGNGDLTVEVTGTFRINVNTALDETARPSTTAQQGVITQTSRRLAVPTSQHMRTEGVRRAAAVEGMDSMGEDELSSDPVTGLGDEGFAMERSLPLVIVSKPAEGDGGDADATPIVLVVGASIVGVGVLAFGIAQVVAHVGRAKAVIAAYEAKAAADVVVSAPKGIVAPGNVALQLR
jgi:hypothetical protein